MSAIARLRAFVWPSCVVGVLTAAALGCGGKGSGAAYAGAGGAIGTGGAAATATGGSGHDAAADAAGGAPSGGTGGAGSGGGGSPCQGAACPSCGLPGLPCCGIGTCSGTGAACDDDDGAYTCTACGGPGEPCCATGPACATGTSCQNQICQCTGAGCAACGGAGEPCCTTTPACPAGTVCGFSGCQPCGGPGQPCCTDGTACAGNGCCLAGRCVSDGEACTLPSASYGVCAQGSCGCGNLNQPCCPTSNGVQRTCVDASGMLCLYSNTDQSYTCVSCGGANEPCCNGPAGPCTGTNVCDQMPATPTCLPCGIDGNPCCANNKCATSTACCSDDPYSASGGRCGPSGATCTMLNVRGPGICVAGNCECGLPNQPCCGAPGQLPCATGQCSPTSGLCPGPD
jgi:hypothetical protein